MKQFKTFEDLIIWQNGHEFVLSVYQETDAYPKSELFGLVSQFRRAAVSIPSNIAEGYKKKSINDKLRFYNIAQGSLEECYYYVILSKDLKYINLNKYEEWTALLNRLRALLNGYCSSIIKNRNT